MFFHSVQSVVIHFTQRSLDLLMVHRTLENLENLEISWDEKDDLDNLENLEIIWDFFHSPTSIFSAATHYIDRSVS